MDGKEASDIIEKALTEVISQEEDTEEGDMLVEWAVIAYVSNPASEKGSAYPMYFSNGEIPTYRARGLFVTALKYFENVELE